MVEPEASCHLGEVVLGRYLIENLLGSGAFAWVYRARTRGGEDVAIKVLHATLPGATTRFAREASVLKALPPNPHVVRYVDQGKTRSGRPLLVLEHIDGMTLRQGMKRRGLTPREAVDVLIELCRALAGLHQLGVAHRDIKPANVLLAREGDVKLIDFGVIRDAQGILKLLEDEENDAPGRRVFAAELDVGTLVGSLPYTAPEQLIDFLDPSEVRADTQSDVYSLGIILFELLTGRSPLERRPPPFDCSTAELREYARWRLALRDDDLPEVPRVAAPLARIVAKTLRREMSLRQPDSRALMAELQAYLNTGDVLPDGDRAKTVETHLGDALESRATDLTELDLPLPPLGRDEDATEPLSAKHDAPQQPRHRKSATALFFVDDVEDRRLVGLEGSLAAGSVAEQTTRLNATTRVEDEAETATWGPRRQESGRRHR